MSTQHARQFSRRRFLGGLTLVGTAGFLGLHPRPAPAEPPPETTTLRLVQGLGLCVAPQYVAEELLQAEGFLDVHSVKSNTVRDLEVPLASGDAHLGMHFAAPLVVRLDQADPIVILAGVHIGCFELFGTERVRAIRDLKGKTVAVPDLQTGPITFLASMVAYVGLDPRKDILAGNREFVRTHPVATKRAVRAILKAADVCALEPERVARFLVDKGYTPNYDYALQTMQEVPYDKWREYDPEDTVRFYALRLHEAGMIKSSPQKLIAQGTDWRFLNALKKELKR